MVFASKEKPPMHRPLGSGNLKVRVLLNSRYDGLVVFCPFSIGFCSVNRAERMLRRRINGINFQRCSACVNNVVPLARRDDHGIITVHLLTVIQRIFRFAHHYKPTAAFNSQKLIKMRMYLKTDISARRNTHKRHLKVPARPQCRSEILICFSSFINVYNERFSAVITDCLS